MLDFSVLYPKTKFIVLTNNYRSNQEILDLATTLIKNNLERITNKIKTINKKLISTNKPGKKPQLFTANNDIEEKTFILNTIKEEIEK
jgi:DNA helicase II / ATP-dependent DNA helicase PcrA